MAEDTSGRSGHGTSAAQAQRLVLISPADCAKLGAEDQRESRTPRQAKGLMHGPGSPGVSGAGLLAPAFTFARLLGKPGNTVPAHPWGRPSLLSFPSRLLPLPHPPTSGLDHPLGALGVSFPTEFGFLRKAPTLPIMHGQEAGHRLC